VVQDEGSWTLNPVKYHSVPVELIPTTPLIEQLPFHVEHGSYAVTAILEPINPPIIIPASGGSFDFDVTAYNTGEITQTFQGWIDVTLPDGSSYGPLFGPELIALTSDSSTTWQRTQSVPASAPAGSYVYRAYVGAYPYTYWSSDDFIFTKVDTGAGEIVEEWKNTERLIESDTGKAALPSEIVLRQPYPNPFNPATLFSFILPEASHVNLQIYNLQGRLVATLMDGMRDAGSHEVTFDASHLSSGIYLYRLTAGSFTASGKMVLVK